MKFGFRIPSINKRIGARTAAKRYVRQNLGFKAPRGMGWIVNPKKAAYNRVYNRTSKGCVVALLLIVGSLSSAVFLLVMIFKLIFRLCRALWGNVQY